MYCTADDILTTMSREDLITLTNADATTARDIDVEYLNKIIADSEKIIDGYIASRYSLPFTTVPPLIKRICKELTFCNLHTFGNYSDTDKASVIKKRYDEAIAMLKDIAAGILLLGDNAQPQSGVEGSASFSSRTRIYTDDFLTKF